MYYLLNSAGIIQHPLFFLLPDRFPLARRAFLDTKHRFSLHKTPAELALIVIKQKIAPVTLF